MISTDDPRVVTTLRDLHRQAIAAGYEDPIFGALVIASTALVGLEAEAPAGRHPRGKARAGGVD